jgi:hypothetical protein
LRTPSTRSRAQSPAHSPRLSDHPRGVAFHASSLAWKAAPGIFDEGREASSCF